MHVKTRLVIASLTLCVCVIVNFLATPSTIYQTHGFIGVLLAAIFELGGSIAIPFVIFLVAVFYKVIKRDRISVDSIEFFLFVAVIFALMNSVGNIFDVFTNVNHS
jgi:hypothetical protein